MPARPPEREALPLPVQLAYRVGMETQAATLDRLIDALGGYGQRPALLAVDGERVSTMDFTALHQRLRRVAGLLAAAGASPGDRVLLFGTSGEAWILGCLAALRLRCTVVPLDQQAGGQLLERVMAGCEPRFAFADQSLAGALGEAGFAGQWWPLDALPDAIPPATLPACEPDDIAVLFYTSGTTGEPKGVPLTHRNLAWQVETIRTTRLLRTDDRMLLPLPLHHVYPLVLGMLMPLAMGVTLVLPAAVTGPELVRALKLGEATIIIGVPRLYEALLAGIEARVGAAPAPARGLLRALWAFSALLRRWFDLPAGRWLLRPLHRALAPRLRALASGGAALDAVVASRLAALGWDIAIGYGLTETSPLLTLKHPDGRHLDSVGRPVAGVELRVEVPERDEAAAGDGADEDERPGRDNRNDGEILARGPGVFSGYYRQPEETRRAFTADGWFRTGDLGRIDGAGYVQIAGRVSSMIVTAAGKNVYPEDVEKAYLAHPLIADIGVVADNGGLGALVVADADGLQRLRVTPAAALRAAMAEAAVPLPRWMRVGRFLVSDTPLERTRLGKVRRHLLVRRYARLRAGDGEAPGRPVAVSEMKPTDQALLESPAAEAAWELLAARYANRALDPDSSTRTELGIDSLDWLELSLEIARRTGVELHEDDIAGIDSVRDLLAAVAGAEPGVGPGGRGGEGRTPISDPEAFLGAAQRRWLEPLSPAEQRLARLLGGLTRGAVGWWWRLEVRGLEHLQPGRQYIVTPNHQSLLDPFLVGAALPNELLYQTAWGGWTGMAFRNAVFRWGSRLARVVPVDPDRAVVSSLAFAAATLRQGSSLVWFPEGRRSPTGELMSFRPGIGMLLDGVQVPAVPAWIEGAHESLPPGKRFPRRVRVRLRFGAPVSGDELAAEGDGPDRRSRIVSALERRVRELAG